MAYLRSDKANANAKTHSWEAMSGGAMCIRCSVTTWVGDTVEEDRMRDKRVFVLPACKAIDVTGDISGREHRAHIAAAWRHAFGIDDDEYRRLCMPSLVVVPVGDTRRIRVPAKRAALKCGYGIAQKVVLAMNRERITRAKQGSGEGKAEEEGSHTTTWDDHPLGRAKKVERSGIG